MLSPFVIARDVPYWKFPSSTERLAYVPIEGEITKVAWQASDDTFWFLKDLSPTWIPLGSGGTSGPTLTHNVIDVPTIIPTYYSMVFVAYLLVLDTLTVDGGFTVIG